MQPDVVLGMLDTLGASVSKVLIVGCEPASVDYGIGLSEPVATAVDKAVAGRYSTSSAEEEEAIVCVLAYRVR